MPNAVSSRIKLLESRLDEHTNNTQWMMKAKGLSTLLKPGHTPGRAPAQGEEGPLHALLMEPWVPSAYSDDAATDDADEGSPSPLLKNESTMSKLAARLKAIEFQLSQGADRQRLARQNIELQGCLAALQVMFDGEMSFNEFLAWANAHPGQGRPDSGEYEYANTMFRDQLQLTVERIRALQADEPPQAATPPDDWTSSIYINSPPTASNPSTAEPSEESPRRDAARVWSDTSNRKGTPNANQRQTRHEARNSRPNWRDRYNAITGTD